MRIIASVAQLVLFVWFNVTMLLIVLKPGCLESIGIISRIERMRPPLAADKKRSHLRTTRIAVGAFLLIEIVLRFHKFGDGRTPLW